MASRQGDIDIIPHLDTTGSAAQASRSYIRASTHDSDFEPIHHEYSAMSAPVGTVGATTGVTIPVSAVKSVMGMSNEYWLIGIIIVLVMVVIMLIVYIVRLKNAEETKPASSRGTRDSRAKRELEQDHEHDSDGVLTREQEPVHGHRNIVNLPSHNVLQDIASTPFVPRSAAAATAAATRAQHQPASTGACACAGSDLSARTQEHDQPRVAEAAQPDVDDDARECEDDNHDDPDCADDDHTPPPRATRQHSTGADTSARSGGAVD